MDQDRDGPSTGRGPDRSGQALARGLGWFSIGLGLAEVPAPRRLARAAGIDDREEAARACGILEIAMGVGILGSDNPAPWIWGRGAGGALDVAILAAGAGADTPAAATSSWRSRWWPASRRWTSAAPAPSARSG